MLGHLGLAQLGRTGQRGRDRALVGLTLSYVFIVVAVVAVTVWTITGGRPDAPATVASAPTTTITPTTPPTATTTTPAPPPPPHIVDGAALPGLLLPLEEVTALTGDTGLVVINTDSDVSMPPADKSVYEPVDCIGSFLAGAATAYQGTGYRQFYDTVPGDYDTLLQVVQGVAVFDDAAAAAQKALAMFIAQWTRCAGSTLNWKMMQDRKTAPITLGGPQDAGGGVTTLTNFSSLDHIPYLRAIAAKNNVLVDIQVSGGDHVPDQAAVIAKRILERIPG